MTLNQYQRQAMTTRMSTCENVPYMLLNLQGEVGEFSSKIAKAIRKGCIDYGSYYYKLYETRKDEMPDYYQSLMEEAGDILWQLAGLCDVFDWTLEDVARHNLDKLASRKKRGVIDGNGDNR